MIAINVNKLRMSIARLQQVRKKVADTADGIYRQKIYYLLEAGVRVSPQFSGDFASNWFIVVDGNMPSYKRWPQKAGLDRDGKMLLNSTAQNVHKAGDPEAVSYALARAAGTLKGVTRKNKVHIVNATELTTDGTHMTGPDGTVNLRPENIIPGHVRIETYIRARAKEAKVTP